MGDTYRMPPVTLDPAGRPRRAGFEFELGNRSVTDTAVALAASLGGEVERISAFEAVLHGSSLGRLKVERDFKLLKSTTFRDWLSTFGIENALGGLVEGIESNIDLASSLLIPCEVVTDPIALAELHRLNDLVRALVESGAQGTQDSPIYAFGMHINPSITDLGADSLRRHLQAFLLLHAWFIGSSRIDLTRRFITNYIDPFPEPYLRLLLDPSYRPGIDRLLEDYLAHNPTRNRALDLLPVFCELRREQVMQALPADERKLVRGRPAFHYRLPDCRIGMPGWSPAAAWNQWVLVESLAANQPLLTELLVEWMANREHFRLTPNSAWVTKLTTLLAERFLYEG